MRKLIYLCSLLVIIVACGGNDQADNSADSAENIDSAQQEATEAAPAAESTTNDKITVKFAVSEFEMGTYGDLIEVFEEENPDIDIRLVSSSDILDIDFASGGEYPDDAEERLVRNADVINGFIADFSAESVRQGLILDLAPLIEGDSNFNRSDFWPGLIPDNETVALMPTSVDFNLVFYDRDLFDAAGVDYPTVDWSWDDFQQIASALKIESGQEVEQWGFVQANINPASFVASRVDRPIIDTSQQPPVARFEDEDVREATQWFIDMVEVDQLMPFYAEDSQSDLNQFEQSEGYVLIDEGKAAMWEDYSGSFSFRSFEVSNLGVVSYPSENGNPSTPIHVSGIAISAGTANPNAAWRWVSFLSSQEQPNFGFGGSTQLPVKQSIAESSGFWDDVDPELAEAMRFGIEHGLYLTSPAYRELFAVVDDVLAGEKELDQALADAQEEAEAQFEEEDSAEKVEPFTVVGSPAEDAISADATTITFVTLGQGFDLGQYREIADAFTQENPDIVIEVQPPDFSADPSVGFNMAFIAENADCFQWFSEVQDPDAQAAILPLDAFIEADSELSADDFFPAMVDQFTYQGQLWGLPADLTPVVIAYNHDLFDQAGVDYPTADWTMDQFTDIAIDVTEGDGEFKTYGFVPDAFENNILLLFMERYGANIIDNGQEPPTMTLNAPETIAALRWYADMYTQLGVKPAFITDPTDFAGNGGVFADREGIIDEGRAGMWTETDELSGGGFGLGDRSTMSIGYAPIPAGAGGAGLTPANGYFISAETPFRRQCWDWITFLTESAEIVSGIPGRIDVAESAEYRNNVGAEKADAFFASIDTIGDAESSIFRLFSGDNDWLGIGTFWLGRAHQQVIDGDASVEEALSDAQLLFDDYRNCVIANDGLNDNDTQEDCAQEADPSLPAFLFGG